MTEYQDGAYYDSNQSDTQELISKLNSGGLINIRLDFLWRETQKHSRVGKYSDWNADLDCVWRELAGDIKPGSNDEKEYEKIERQLSQVGVNNWTAHSGFKTIKETQGMKMTSQYRTLIKKEVFLRRLQNKQGKGTAYSQDDDDYMDG